MGLSFPTCRLPAPLHLGHGQPGSPYFFPPQTTRQGPGSHFIDVGTDSEVACLIHLIGPGGWGSGPPHFCCLGSLDPGPGCVTPGKSLPLSGPLTLRPQRGCGALITLFQRPLSLPLPRPSCPRVPALCQKGLWGGVPGFLLFPWALLLPVGGARPMSSPSGRPHPLHPLLGGARSLVAWLPLPHGS